MVTRRSLTPRRAADTELGPQLTSLPCRRCFGKSEAKAAQDNAAKAEADRLGTLSPADMAVVLMGVFGPDGPKGRGPNGGINIPQVGIALLDKIPRGTKYLSQLQEPIREGLQVLEHAELVLRTTRQTGTRYNATRLGETALADASVQQKIQAHQ
jgi:hypothetical protein